MPSLPIERPLADALGEGITADKLLDAAQPGDPVERQLLAGALARCLEKARWLESFLGSDTRALSEELRRRASDVRLESIKGLRGPARGFFDTRPGALMYLEQLRGLLLVALVRDRDAAIPAGALDRLVTLITSLARSSPNPLRAGLLDLDAETTSLSLAEILSKVFPEADDSDRARDFRRIWIPLLSKGAKRVPAPKPAAPNPAPNPGTRSPTRHRDVDGDRVPSTRIRTVRTSQVGLDPVLAEAEPQAHAVAVPTEELPDSSAYELFFSERAGRRANSQLIDGNVDALTDTEAAVLAEALLRESDDSDAPLVRPARLAALLMLATGTTLGDLQQMEVASSALVLDRFRLVLCCQSGTLCRPILFDKAPPVSEISARHWIEIPLPPPIGHQLKNLRPGWLHVLGDNPATHIRDLLSNSGLSTKNFTLGRIRHWSSVAIQRAGDDLAATMLLCGDTFARSPAPLYYYAPRHSDLEQLYRKAVWPTFEPDCGRAQRPSRSHHVGFATLVTDDMARAYANSFRRPRSQGGDKSWSAADPHARHNAFCDEVVGHFLVITTHRPTDAIGRIRLHDLALDDGLAVISDKRVDAAHWYRAAAMSPSLCEHLTRYLEHLARLSESELISSETRELCRRAADGEDSLFFHIRPDGQKRRLSIAAWKSGLSAPSSDVAPNWYRCYLAMALRSLNVPPGAMMTQMGHLEAAGFPMSRSSPVNLLAWARSLRDTLETISVQIGMQFEPVRRARTSPSAIGAVDWARRLELRARCMERIHGAMKRQFRQVEVDHRDAVALRVIAAIKQHAPELAQALETSSPSRIGNESQEGPTLETEVFAAIVDNVERLSDDPLLSVSHRLELARLLRKARKHHHWRTPRYAAVVVASGADPTPLFPGLMLARRQMQDLRRFWLKHLPPDDPCSRIAFLTLGLLIWSPSPTQASIEKILLSSQTGFRLTDASDLVLFPGGDAPEAVRAYCGLIAAQVHVESGGLGVTCVDWSKLGDQIAQMLPAEFQADGNSVVDQVIAISKVNSIIEQSPLGRLASERRYCRAVNAELQTGFLTGSLVQGLEQQDSPPPDITIEAESIARSQRQTADQIKKLSSEYNELIAVLRTETGQHKFLPRTEVTLLADQIATKKGTDAIVDELVALRAEEQSKVVRALTAYAHDMLTNGTAMRESPALGTVRTYVGSIASRLIKKFKDEELSSLDPDDILDRYNEIIVEASGDGQSAPPSTPGAINEGATSITSSGRHIRSHARVGQQLLHFHRVAMKEIGMSAIDVHDLLIDPQDVAEDDDALIGGATNLVTEAEYEAARGLLAKWAAAPGVHPDQRRLTNIADLQLVLMFHGGLRVREVAGLLLEDLILGDPIHVIVRNNGFRRTKNPLRKRLIVLLTLGMQEREDLVGWHAHQKVLLQRSGNAAGGLFTKALDARSVHSESEIRTILSAALEAGSGRHLWPHLLRHTSVCRSLLNVYAVDQGAEKPPSPRDIRRICDAIGHQSAATTLGYFHFPWRLQEWAAEIPAPIKSRQALAALSGRSKLANDKLFQREQDASEDRQKVAQLLERSWPTRVAAANNHESPQSDPPNKRRAVDTLGELDLRLQLLSKLQRAKASETPLGWNRDEIDYLRNSATQLKEKIGYDLFVDPTPRIADLDLRGFKLDLVKSNDPRLGPLVEWFKDWYRAEDARRHGAIRCPPEQADWAKQQLIALGCPEEIITIQGVQSRDRVRSAQISIKHPDDKRSLIPRLTRLLAVALITQGRIAKRQPDVCHVPDR